MELVETSGRVERRVAQRFRVGLPVTVDRPGHRCAAVSIDISAGGLGLRLSDTPQIGHEISVAIHLPSGETIDATAEVVRRGSDGGEIGVRFRKLRPQALTALHAFLSHQAVILH